MWCDSKVIQDVRIRAVVAPECGGSEVRIILAASPRCGLLNQSHTRSLSCQCPSIPKFANESAAEWCELRNRDTSSIQALEKKRQSIDAQLADRRQMRWPVSAHTSSNCLDAQRNSSGCCIGLLASELLGDGWAPDSSMTIKHRRVCG